MSQVKPLPALHTPKQIARRWGIKVDGVLELIHAGKLPALNIGQGLIKGRYRVRPEDLAQFEEGRRVEPPARRGRRPKKRRPPGWVSYFGS